MIHRYQKKGLNFVLDVNSGAVHLLDDISYAVSGLLDENMGDTCPQGIIDALPDYTADEIREEMAPKVIAQERHIYKGVSANVDFYSGFVYSMLGLPPELYTPVFAMARIVGWSAHRLEELINTDKIIRPAYRCVQPAEPYVALKER